MINATLTEKAFIEVLRDIIDNNNGNKYRAEQPIFMKRKSTFTFVVNSLNGEVTPITSIYRFHDNNAFIAKMLQCYFVAVYVPYDRREYSGICVIMDTLQKGVEKEHKCFYINKQHLHEITARDIRHAFE